MDIIKKMAEIFKEENLYPEEYWQDPDLPIVFYVTIDGDWKHDHGYIDYLMGERLGLKKMGERDVEENGEDWYQSTHVYISTQI